MPIEKKNTKFVTRGQRPKQPAPKPVTATAEDINAATAWEQSMLPKEKKKMMSGGTVKKGFDPMNLKTRNFTK